MAVFRSRIVEDATYGIGALASASFTTVPGLILLYYLTNTLAISASVAGFIVFLPKLFDIFLNPLVGRWSDRTRTRFGARRPWIFVGGILFPIAFVATFWTPYSGPSAAIWVGVAFTIASMTFAGFIVPWSSLPAEIAPDTQARTSMAAWRIAFLSIAILLSGGLAPSIVEGASNARSGYREMALTMGCIMIVATLTVALIGARRSTPATTQPAAVAGFRESLSMLRASAPLRAMFWLVGLTEVSAAVSLASTPYLADYVLGDTGAVATMFVILTIPLLITMPLWRAVALRIGKRSALNLALLIFAAGALMLLSLAVTPPEWRQPVVFVAVFIVGFGFAGTSMLPQAMFSDALAYETALRGESNVGAMVGGWNAAETITGGLGAAAFAAVLTMTGFISAGEDQIVAQPAAAIDGIIFAASLIPALAALAALFPLRGFDLAEDEVDRTTRAPA